MKKPNNRNSPIDLGRLKQWTDEFESYRHPVSENRINLWIDQFDKEDRDLAARVLDCVDFFTHTQISAAFKTVLQGLDGWHKNKTARVGTWRFVAYSASAGKSGDSMLHKFRHANNLSGKVYDELFIYRSDILREGLGKDDTVVLIDDFVGSGNQACGSWETPFSELLATVGRVYLVVVAAFRDGVKRVEDETDLELVNHYYLHESDNVFASSCKQFKQNEKNALLGYCSRADRKNPKGHGDCGLLVVFAHSCPNDSIPILHKSNKKWQGLFRRYD